MPRTGKGSYLTAMRNECERTPGVYSIVNSDNCSDLEVGRSFRGKEIGYCTDCTDVMELVRGDTFEIRKAMQEEKGRRRR